MSTPISDFIKTYYRQRMKYSKSTLFHFTETNLYLGKCIIAVRHGSLLLINETLDMPEVNKLRENLIKISTEFRIHPILIPFKYGEEVMPTNDEIINRLESRLQYWLNNTQELTNYKIRGQYKAYFEQYEKFITTNKQAQINSQLKTLYTSLNDKEFIKRLQLQVARRKSNLK